MSSANTTHAAIAITRRPAGQARLVQQILATPRNIVDEVKRIVGEP